MRLARNVLCLTGIAISAAFAMSHHALNGAWRLIPERSDFGGRNPIQSGAVTINDREGNISVSRNFTFDGGDESYMESFTLDGRENSSIKNGKTFKTKARWEHDGLTVTTVRDGVTTMEHYFLGPDGTLRLNVEAPGHPPINLVLQRQ